MEKIEVGYRNIGSVGSIEYYHKFLLYTDSNGNQYTISGWTGNDVSSTLPLGRLSTLANIPYDKNNPDHPDYSEKNKQQKQYREPITEGEDLSNLWNDMANNAKTKDGIYPYDPFLQNSNTFADSVLEDVNLSEPIDDNIYDFSDHWAPASGKELDKNITPINPDETAYSDILGKMLNGWYDEIAKDVDNMTTEMYENLQTKLGELADALNDLLDADPATQPLPGVDDFIPYNPDSDSNSDSDSDSDSDDNTNAPDSGNNNDEDNAPDPLNPPPPPRDPLVLDTDKDGFISTVALSDSNAYFDITGDGIKERVSWIAPNDGILVYDKNESGKIDGIDEVFGNFTKNGFEELKELIDSNHDDKIDRQDELFNRLQIWNDANGDGTTQTNELSSLKDAGVKSIDLNYVTTDITLGGATLTEASKYTDVQNNKELVADVNLEYNPILTTVDTSTIPDYTVDPDTLFLPQLRGYGLIMDSLISYNTNDALKEKALELQAGGIQAIAEGFEEFMKYYTFKDNVCQLVANNIDFKIKREVV